MFGNILAFSTFRGCCESFVLRHHSQPLPSEMDAKLSCSTANVITNGLLSLQSPRGQSLMRPICLSKI
jgi:hypothetical protein